MQQMHDNIPYLFDYWSDPGVYLHLLKSPPMISAWAVG